MCQGVVRSLRNNSESRHVRKVARLLAQPLSPSGEQGFVGHHENLRYSILKPRIRELWWLDILGLRKKEQNTPGKDRTFRLAYSLAAFLSNLKAARMPHCVLSTGNVMVAANPRKLQIEFPGFEEPSMSPRVRQGTSVQPLPKDSGSQQVTDYASEQQVGWFVCELDRL